MSQQTYILLKQLTDHPEQPVDGAPEVEALRQAVVAKDSSAATAAATRCIERGHLPDGFVRKLLGRHGVEDVLTTAASGPQQAIAKARRGDILTPAEWVHLPPWLRHRTPHPESGKPVPTLKQALSFAQAVLTGTYVSEAVRLQRQAICARCPYQRADKAGDPWCSICGCSVGDKRQIRNLAAYEERLPQWGCKHPNRAKGEGWVQPDAPPKPFDLAGFFDLVVVINLRRRPDRFAAFSAALAEAAWPFRYPIRFEAVDGAIHRPPAWWRAGNGAWGCRCSQLTVVEQAIRDGVQSLLILEDDAVFAPDFAGKVEAFLRAVPDDWHSLYLGGQHLKKPTSVSDGVVLASNVNRCHAWAARGEFLKTVRDHWSNLTEWQKTPRRHIDHQLGVLHESGRYRVYAPTQWLVGQNAGQSNICGKPLAQRFWGHAPSRRPSILAYRAFTRSGQKLGPLANVKAWAEAEGKSFAAFDVPETWAKAGETVRRIRDAEMVFIWNGAEPGCAWARRVCQAHGTPFIIAENGLLPQKGYWHLDPQGIIGDSSLCGPLVWVTGDMLAAADRHIERHFAARRWKYTGDGGYVIGEERIAAVFIFQHGAQVKNGARRGSWSLIDMTGVDRRRVFRRTAGEVAAAAVCIPELLCVLQILRVNEHARRNLNVILLDSGVAGQHLAAEESFGTVQLVVGTRRLRPLQVEDLAPPFVVDVGRADLRIEQIAVGVIGERPAVAKVVPILVDHAAEAVESFILVAAAGIVSFQIRPCVRFEIAQPKFQ